VSAVLSLYAVTAPGLEPCTAAELLALGIAPTETESGGVAFQGSLEDMARANLWLRTASRVLVRIASFRARALGELERKAADVPWTAWLPPGVPLALRVSCSKSRLYHQKAVGERIARAVGAGGGGVIGATRDEEDGTDQAPTTTGGAQLLVVRLFRDECTISIDSSGELLHRRGYRLASGKAPVRETLAAALLLAGGWDPSTTLVDPFSGSGTIPIEAALLARRLPPGRQRSFAFQRWPRGDATRWQALLDAADAAALPRAPAAIIGADRDAGAVASARENAARAGVDQDIEFRRAAISTLSAPAERGWVTSNPPYGVRVGERGELRNLYARLGQVARKTLAGWHMTLLVPAAPLERETGLTWRQCFRARNGGLPVRAITTVVPGVALAPPDDDTSS
jgi:putative N6-adenine-specific DNA methylase